MQMHLPAGINKSVNSDIVRQLLLIVFAAIAFFPVFSNGFTNLDDMEQVTMNPDIQQLSFQNLKIIFSSYYVGMYQPFTTVCFAIIYKLFALKAFAYHGFSFLIHVANILLVYRLLKKLSSRREVVFGVALLFAVNPMQTEAVAWVSATSTLLYSMFYLLALNFYFSFIDKNRSGSGYLLALLAFVFSLLSKSAAVTLPLVLLLFDYYKNSKISRKDILNKIPFLALSVLFGIITIMGRKEAGHIFDVTKYYNLFDRFLFVLTSVSFYITSIFAPFRMSAFHPYPGKSGNVLPVMFYLMPVLLLAIIVLFVKIKKGRKEMLFGFLFFLLSISVMIELIPVGLQIVKERYTYIPGIGIYFGLFSFLFMRFEKMQMAKTILKFSLAGLALFFVLLSFGRSGTWKNSYTLWNDVIKKYPEVSSAYINRGNAYVNDGYYKKAIADYSLAIKYEPGAADAYICRAVARSNASDPQGALEDYNKAISLGPVVDSMYTQRAVLRLGLNDAEGAIEDFGNAIKLSPEKGKFYNQRGIILGMIGKLDEALADFEKAIELDPDFADAYSNRGYAEMSLSQHEKALQDFTLAIEKNPSEARTYFLRGLAYEAKGDSGNACLDLKKAKEMGFEAATEEIAKVCK